MFFSQLSAPLSSSNGTAVLPNCHQDSVSLLKSFVSAPSHLPCDGSINSSSYQKPVISTMNSYSIPSYCSQQPPTHNAVIPPYPNVYNNSIHYPQGHFSNFTPALTYPGTPECGIIDYPLNFSQPRNEMPSTLPSASNSQSTVAANFGKVDENSTASGNFQHQFFPGTQLPLY